MNEDIFEVSRDEYVGFLGQIKKEALKVEVDEEKQELHVYSADGARHFASMNNDEETGAHYYVYEMPLDEERCAPRAIRKYTLETKEEVEALFEILKKAQGGEK